MPDRTEGPGRYALIADALVSGEPEPERMAAYAADPDSLQPAERERIEAAIRRDPGLAAELEVLRRFQVPIDAAAPALRRAPPARSRRRWTRAAQIGLPLSAAAALALYLAVPRAPVDALAPAATPAAGSPVQVAELQAPAPSTPPPTPAPLAEATPSGPPPAEAPQRSEVALRDAPSAAAPRRAESAPQPAPAEPEPARPVNEEAVLVAMAIPRYAPPTGGREVFRPVQVFRDRSRPRVIALSPEHVTTTPEPSPDLFWAIGSVADGEAIEFEIGPIGEAPLRSVELGMPERPGLQRLSLAKLGISLPPGVDVTWTVTLIRSRSDAAENPTGQGWLRRIERAPDLAALEATPLPERVKRCAEAGLWNEALAGAVELTERHPESAAAKALLDGLLRQASVEMEGPR